MSSREPVTESLVERLLADGALSAEEMQRARSAAAGAGEPLLGALLRAGVLDEDEVVATLTQRLGWVLAPEERLLHASLSPRLRERVPESLARACLALPLALDPQRRRLTVALCDPTDHEVCERLRGAAEVAELRPLVSRRSLLLRAIAACYAPPPAVSARWPNPAGARAASAAAAPPTRPRPAPAPAPAEPEEGGGWSATMAPTHGWAPTRAVEGEGALLEEACAGIGVLVAMLEERVDPQAGRSRELARLTRGVLRARQSAESLIARAALAAHLLGLEITLRQELGVPTLPRASELFATDQADPGGIGPVLRALGRRALADLQPDAEPAFRGAGCDDGGGIIEATLDGVAGFLARTGAGASPVEAIAALRGAGGDPQVIEGLARLAQRAESRPPDGPHPLVPGVDER